MSDVPKTLAPFCLILAQDNRCRGMGIFPNERQRITTHYSEAELANLIEAAEKACEIKSRKTPAIS